MARLRYLTAGESHGPALTGIMEGMPAGLPVTVEDIHADGRRRMMGYGRGNRMKIETDEVKILAGVLPLKSHKVALYMKSKVSGMSVPDSVVERMKKASDPKAEGIRLCVETIERLRHIDGVAGVHIMAPLWEEKVPEIVQRAGLLPRPVL